MDNEKFVCSAVRSYGSWILRLCFAVVSCRSWTLKICFAVISCRSWILVFHFDVVSCGSWTLRICFTMRSCRSWILIFHFVVISCGSWTLGIYFAARSWRSWILIFHFAVVSCGSWTFEDLFCREILQILDLGISFCRRILWILDPIFWPRHKSAPNSAQSWLLEPPSCDTELPRFSKPHTHAEELRQEAQKHIVTNYTDCTHYYTDGSKASQGTGCAFVSDAGNGSRSLPKEASVLLPNLLRF